MLVIISESGAAGSRILVLILVVVIAMTTWMDLIYMETDGLSILYQTGHGIEQRISSYMNRINLTPGVAKVVRFGWYLRNYPLSEEIWEELSDIENLLVLFHPVTHLYGLSDVGFNRYVGS